MRVAIKKICSTSLQQFSNSEQLNREFWMKDSADIIAGSESGASRIRSTISVPVSAVWRAGRRRGGGRAEGRQQKAN
jgi:hypothetical protein